MSRRRKRGDANAGPKVDRQPPWAIVYYLDPAGVVPALEFLDACPGKIDAEFTAVLDAVAAAPPPQFWGWQVGGDARVNDGLARDPTYGPGREQFRLFCLLENADDDERLKRGLVKPAIAVIVGMRKPWRSTFTSRDYERVHQLGEEHKANRPRRVAT